MKKANHKMYGIVLIFWYFKQNIKTVATSSRIEIGEKENELCLFHTFLYYLIF